MVFKVFFAISPPCVPSYHPRLASSRVIVVPHQEIALLISRKHTEKARQSENDLIEA